MNAWICDGCGAIVRERPLGWFAVSTLIELPDKRDFFNWSNGKSKERLFCTSDCLAANYLLASVEDGAK